MTQKEVYNYFEKNYPDVDLYETKKGSFFGGYGGMDQLELFETNLVVFCVEKVKGRYVPKQKNIFLCKQYRGRTKRISGKISLRNKKRGLT